MKDMLATPWKKSSALEELLQNSELLSLGKPYDHGW